MMKFQLSALLLLVTSYTSFGQLLWKISGNGLNQESYLYGTMHAVPEERFTVSNTLKQAFESSKALALEIDLNLSLQQQIEIAKDIIIPQGKSLKNYLSTEDYKKVMGYCLDSLKMKKSKFKKYEKIKPFFASSMILQEQLGKTVAYDQYFNEEAKKRSIPVSGLETMQYQLSTINTISLEEQAEMLVTSLGKEMMEYQAMLDLYLANDLKGLHDMVISSDMSSDAFTQNFLVKRNQNWIPGIKKMVETQTSFIAVGAAHLPGETGVIELLKKEGFTVEPVN
jgi:uncharacterized protein YbaP (TraB family)